LKKITLRAIGAVHNPVREGKQKWAQVTSEIELLPEHAERLDGIEGFSHIQVIFCLDRVSRYERQMKKFHPQDREDLPLVGAFATRSQRRPNPIGLTTARLLGRNENILLVKGLDALDGTPVLDIKPYSPHLDSARRARVPQWMKRVEEVPRVPLHPGHGHL
jgi:tRNA-Thr(GGU) m(6)t(6)A37 methyltransferase TsaA